MKVIILVLLFCNFVGAKYPFYFPYNYKLTKQDLDVTMAISRQYSYKSLNGDVRYIFISYSIWKSKYLTELYGDNADRDDVLMQIATTSAHYKGEPLNIYFDKANGRKAISWMRKDKSCLYRFKHMVARNGFIIIGYSMPIGKEKMEKLIIDIDKIVFKPGDLKLE